MKEGMEVLIPLLEDGKVEPLGRVVLGTVRGDMHDIGKDIVKMLLAGARFEVFDLGVDVEAETFIEKVKETGASIMAMSAMLTIAMLGMGSVIEELKQSGIRDEVKVSYRFSHGFHWIFTRYSRIFYMHLPLWRFCQ